MAGLARCVLKVKVGSHSYSKRLERGLTEVTGLLPARESESAAAVGARCTGCGEGCLPVLPVDGLVSASLPMCDVSESYLGGTARKASDSISE